MDVNLLTSPNDLTTWAQRIGDTVAHIAGDGPWFQSGDSCTEVTTPGTGSALGQAVAVVPGDTLTVSMWAKRGTALDACWSIFDNTHSAFVFHAESYFSKIVTGAWKQVFRDFVVPAGCTSIQVAAESDCPAAGTVRIAHVRLQKKTIAPAINPSLAKGIAPSLP